ncbi:MAG: hypothetical protein MK119_16670, partial [Kordia sp.]|nr:hypothetical protein [Kordia sp.]
QLYIKTKYFIMKKRQLETLRLRKEVISNLREIQINGGKLDLKTDETQGDYCTRSCTGVGSCNQ